ncbi:MAG: DsbA family protein [Candidatus Nanopelagicales bacterium]
MSITTSEVAAPEPRRTADGAVVLEWWADLACPDCTDALDILEALQERYDDRLTIRLRHLPLTMHVWAVAAAQCAVEAAEQGRGDEYAVAALRMVDDVEGPADYVELADSLGLDADAVAEALFDGRHSGTVHDDAQAARALGAAGTPTFVVDGLLVNANETLDGALEMLVERIDAALA